jgi:transposase-like protein
MTATTACPVCASADVRLKLPDTPETLSYRCGGCGASWTVDADAWLQEALGGADTPAPEA